MSKKLIITNNPPDDFVIIAQNARCYEMIGYTEQDGYEEIEGIPYDFHQRCLPAEWGDRHMSLNEILVAKMSIDGTLLAVTPVMAAVIPAVDAIVATPIVHIMSARSSKDLNFEPFTASIAVRQTLRKGWGYYDSDTGIRGVWIKETQECGDSSWKPGGAGYANWRIVPLLNDQGIPVWVMGVYANKDSVWDYNSILYTSMIDQAPSLWEPGTTPAIWVIKND